MNNKLQRLLNRARWWLLSEQPFYGQLACGLTDEFAPVQTACTNGVKIKWDPAFVSNLSEEELRGVLIHETLHCAHGHLWRLPIDETANVACVAEGTRVTMADGHLMRIENVRAG